MEQELENKKKKKEIVKDTDKVYESEEFLEKVDEFYNTYGTFKLTAKKLNEEFKTCIKPDTVSRIYKKQIAIKFSDDQDATKFFENSFIRMQKRWEDSWEMIGDLVSEYKKFRKVIKERSQDDLTEAITFMKMANQILQITAEIRKQLEFIQKQQEEIRVYQQNNLIISPIQINQEVKKIFTSMSKREIQEFFKSLGDNRFAEVVRNLPDRDK